MLASESQPRVRHEMGEAAAVGPVTAVYVSSEKVDEGVCAPLVWGRGAFIFLRLARNESRSAEPSS